MNPRIKKPKLIISFALTSLIVLANFSLYNFQALQPLPNEVVLGSIVDFLIVIPLITYVFIIRKRYSLKYLGLVILAGYGAAHMIIPNGHLQQYSFFHYIVAISEGALMCLELYILVKVITKLPILIKDYKSYSEKNMYFQLNLRKSIETHFPKIGMFQVFLTEFSLFYSSLFCWRKNITLSEKHFTYHKKTSGIAVYILLIHATVLESVGFHFLLHQWNPIVAYILLFLNTYGILFFLAEIQAIRLTTFLIAEKTLYLQVGISKSMEVPFDKIKEVKYCCGPEKFS